ncbi:MAG TPA: mevalonate kinase [Candidatus Nitrosocosmicus sp.]|nr:mevalonate kinase [Candidatus Nitrosocosmicus sp.]
MNPHNKIVEGHIEAAAPGKMILFGEHFVVYGYPSLIASIDKFFKIKIDFTPSTSHEINIKSNLGFSATIRNSTLYFPHGQDTTYHEIIKKLYSVIQYLVEHFGIGVRSKSNILISLDSEIPLGGGLGSSSAFCVALTGALYHLLENAVNKDIICYQSINAEKILNRDTSGADCSICTFGGLGRFDRLNGFKRISADFSDYRFLIINSGVSHDTFSMVEKVAKIKNNFPNDFNNLCIKYEDIYNKVTSLLEHKDLEQIGELFNRNHELLDSLSLSSPILNKIINICNSEGSLGTKITGAGGGGSVLSFLHKDDLSVIKNILKRLDLLNLKYFFAKIDPEGLRINHNTT